MQLPPFGTVIKIGLLAGAIVAGGWVAMQAKERRALVASLEAHAVAYPQDAAVVEILVGCNMKPILNVQDCGKQLLDKFGPEVMQRLATMADAGAFTPRH
ncbi:hypothetical protein [Paucibacter soli]|uniref:hypothetical protein n=1 Tax=Paucibacter soli TaxID=3133433 RepID=UPI0030A673B4